VTALSDFTLVDRVSARALQALAHGEILGIRHIRYVSDACCATASRKVREVRRSRNRTSGRPVSLGVVVGDALAGPAGRRAYLDAGLQAAHTLRELFSPFASPVDNLFAELNEAWPQGALFGEIGGQSVPPATIRTFEKGDALDPHVDRHEGDLLIDLCSRRRLAANIYLEVPPPDSGGALEIWDQTLSPADCASVHSAEFAIRRDELGRPALAIYPSVGDLLLFDTSYVHAVSSVTGGSRVTLSLFVGICSDGAPLSIFA